MQGGRDLDADGLPERQRRRLEDGPAHPRTQIDERRPGDVEGHMCEQAQHLSDGRRLVVRRVFDRGADRLGIEIAEKEQRFRDDAVIRVEALSGPSPGNAHP